MNTEKLSCQAVAEIDAICAAYDNQEGELINILKDTQDRLGYLPLEAQHVIAGHLHVPAQRVYGVVTFYAFFTMEPKGSTHLGRFLGPACYVRGGRAMLDDSGHPGHRGGRYHRPTACSRSTACCVWVPADWRRWWSSAKKVYAAAVFRDPQDTQKSGKKKARNTSDYGGAITPLPCPCSQGWKDYRAERWFLSLADGAYLWLARWSSPAGSAIFGLRGVLPRSSADLWLARWTSLTGSQISGSRGAPHRVSLTRPNGEGRGGASGRGLRAEPYLPLLAKYFHSGAAMSDCLMLSLASRSRTSCSLSR